MYFQTLLFQRTLMITVKNGYFHNLGIRLAKEDDNKLNSADSKQTTLEIPKSSVVFFEINTKITKRLKDCHNNGNQRVMSCVKKFIKSRLNCSPTWNTKISEKKICNASQERQYLRYLFDYQNQNLPEAEFCRVPNCEEIDWTLRPFFTMRKKYIAELFNAKNAENLSMFGIRFNALEVSLLSFESMSKSLIAD